mmetsp:Transcript_42128/g.51145  ORF Transcript_42128/g.51145 Transcript_42128/m.51145 type:complete len:317 (-) Transcript_42128:481-1431(-)
MNDLSRSTGSLSLDSEADPKSLRMENERLKARIASLEGSGARPVDIPGGRSDLEIPFEELELEPDQVGGGGFSLVYRGYWRGTQIAAKKWFDQEGDDKVMQEFRSEVMTLQNMRHPNVVQMLGACMRPPNLCIVLEYLPMSLFQVLYGGKIDIDRKRAVDLATDVCRVCQYLHSRSPPVIHRDIKPQNFLVDRAWKVKICDFGLASSLKTQTGSGTPHYMAPELLTQSAFNEKVDVYAFGIMLNELIEKVRPWAELEGSPDFFFALKEKVLAGERPAIPVSTPRKLQVLIKDCWHQESALRPSFADIQRRLKECAN